MQHKSNNKFLHLDGSARKCKGAQGSPREQECKKGGAQEGWIARKERDMEIIHVDIDKIQD